MINFFFFFFKLITLLLSLPVDVSVPTPRRPRRTKDPTTFAPFGEESLTDGQTDAVGRERERHGGRRDAARPAESRSALVRHRALEKLQQPSDIPTPHSLSLLRPTVYTCGERATVCARVCAGAGAGVSARGGALTPAPAPFRPRFSSDGLRARIESGVYDRVRERTGG